ncbi:MAG TPA: rod shape-determining protein MreC [Acidobacteriaceae bacterium]|jgi:rod shape-determining protein MreC|nr:rod shape-determining protein MreC [Acidobacteriaceae bacterium]
MDSFFARYKNVLVLIVIVLLQVVALAVQVPRSGEGTLPAGSPDGPRITMLRRWTVALVTPVERLVHATSLHTRNTWESYVYLRGARKQNEQLKQEVAQLREEQAAFAEDAAQGRRLEALLKFQQQYIAHTVAAQVIGTSGSDRSHVLYLDKGWGDGLRPDQPVITPYGVVGKLRDVFPHTSQLLLISDTSSGAGVILESSRIRGIVRGTVTGQVEINNLTEDSRIKPGETVITSGGDQVFPRGLPVGTIESIAPDPQHQPYTAIVIKPAADLTRLEEVLVITKISAALPPAAQADAAQAETTATDETRRAADLLAEKLPSVQDETNGGATGAQGAAAKAANGAAADLSPGQIGGLPGVPYSGLPKVPPPVHPDRYTPGATPPATELKPGAAAAPRAAAAPGGSAQPQGTRPAGSQTGQDQKTQ